MISQKMNSLQQEDQKQEQQDNNMNQMTAILVKQINDKLQENINIPTRNILVDVRNQLIKLPEDISLEDFGKEMELAKTKIDSIKEIQ